MKYTVDLEEKEQTLHDDAGDQMTEVELALKIYQDLKQMRSVYVEDIFIKNVLAQILDKQYDGNIPIPEFYKEAKEGEEELNDDES